MTTTTKGTPQEGGEETNTEIHALVIFYDDQNQVSELWVLGLVDMRYFLINVFPSLPPACFPPPGLDPEAHITDAHLADLLPVAMQRCYLLLRDIMAHPAAVQFNFPVDRYFIPSYYRSVPQPIAFSDIRRWVLVCFDVYQYSSSLYLYKTPHSMHQYLLLISLYCFVQPFV